MSACSTGCSHHPLYQHGFLLPDRFSCCCVRFQAQGGSVAPCSDFAALHTLCRLYASHCNAWSVVMPSACRCLCAHSSVGFIVRVVIIPALYMPLSEQSCKHRSACHACDCCLLSYCQLAETGQLGPSGPFNVSFFATPCCLIATALVFWACSSRLFFVEVISYNGLDHATENSLYKIPAGGWGNLLRHHGPPESSTTLTCPSWC